MAKSLAQFEVQTCQTDDSDPDNRLPEMSDPTRIFSQIRIWNSVTRFNQVEFGLGPKPIRPDPWTPLTRTRSLGPSPFLTVAYLPTLLVFITRESTQFVLGLGIPLHTDTSRFAISHLSPSSNFHHLVSSSKIKNTRKWLRYLFSQAFPLSVWSFNSRVLRVSILILSTMKLNFSGSHSQSHTIAGLFLLLLPLLLPNLFGPLGRASPSMFSVISLWFSFHDFYEEVIFGFGEKLL